MKKKIKARDLREAKKQEKLASITAKAEAKVHVAEEKPVVTENDSSDKAISNKKSANKAAGLKSTLVFDDKLYTTSFGRGNEAVIEQVVNTSDYSVSDIKTEPSLEIHSADDISFSFSSKRPFAANTLLSAVNPLYSGKDKPEKKVGKDMLGLKDELEIRYFGRTFDDNLHIQIIYNILDIEKILAVYAVNITAAIDHMVDGDSDEYLDSDFIGNMGTNNTYKVFMDPLKAFGAGDNRVQIIDCSRDKFEKLLKSKRLGYFGFEYDNKSKDKRKQEEIKKRLYHLIAFAGQLRQWSFHSAGDYPRTWLYNLEDKRLNDEYRDTLDHYFDQRFNEINDNYVSQNATNLYILKEVFFEEDIKYIADLYYDFIVIKSQKNMGFSIRKLREKMLEIEGAERIKAQDMDSVRSKLYKLIDFCIFKYYHELPEISEKNVDILRAAVSEAEKDEFYTAESAHLWSLFSERFLGFCENIMSWSGDKEEHEKEMVSIIDKDAYRNRSGVSYFSKLLYAMCFFLDGKEINDLLTTLINKFDNIASFISTARELEMDVKFVNDYDFFNSSGKYVSELNIVKNIARMKKPTEKAKDAMYRDALIILGVPVDMKDEAFNAEIEKMLEKKKNPATGKIEKGKNPFRNFIANNVINNSRFIYVIKFCNAENVRKLVNNTKVTEFVLKRMPEKQIDRYYSSCIGSEMNPTNEKKIMALAEMLKAMNFKEFRNVKQKTQTREEALKKERFKAVIGLYLTVVYLLVKNLVNVNARYVMAFHILERDSQLYNVSLKAGKYDNYLALSEKLVNEGENSRSSYLARNKHMRDCVKQDLDNARETNLTTWYRNFVAHLIAVRRCDEYISSITKIDSYFALYHYLIQKQLEKKLSGKRRHSGLTGDYFDKLDRWNTYVKDLVKALNVPFGYNVPRFKALTIDDQFDRNEKGKLDK